MIIKLLRSGKCKIQGWLEGLFNTDKVYTVLGKGYQGERYNKIMIMEVDFVNFYELNETSAEHLRMMVMMKNGRYSRRNLFN